MIGSWKSWNVNPLEWWYPFSAFAMYLPTKSCGRWQSMHLATAWCELLSQLSYCGRMMWQFTQALGSELR